MNFGDAIEAVKAGKRATRKGWNGSGMWIILLRYGSPSLHYKGEVYRVKPCIALKTSQGDLRPGWVASQQDMLAIDWQILDD